MNKNSKDYGAVKNSIAGKTIREMTWEEIHSLAGKRMTQAEAIRQMKEMARKKRNG